MTDQISATDSGTQDERGTLLRLLEVCSASSPAGAAAAHLVRAEREVLTARPREESENKTSVFLLQAVPLVPVLDDLRRAGFPAFDLRADGRSEESLQSLVLWL